VCFFLPLNLLIILEQYIETNDHWVLLVISVIQSLVIICCFSFSFFVLFILFSFIFSWLSVMIFCKYSVCKKGCKFLV
jgi:uncharacterized phage infection (PIP) family protein YhgE